MQLISMVIFTAAACLLVAVNAQNDGPTPPRLSIPGALPIAVRPQYRNEKLSPLVRVRRPLIKPALPLNAIPVPVTPRFLDDAKPVTEEPEDEIPENFVPQIVSQPSPQPIFHEPNSIQLENIPDEPIIPRFQPQERPAPVPRPVENIPSGAQRFLVNQDRPKAVVRRPIYREPKPQQYEPEPVVRQSRPQPVRPAVQHSQHAADHNEVRQRKPVAQIVRKYREEHEDGSITWGYENDDGSFKEETIGIDCVTRGRYGYVDPDGLKREYNYETGILCDPNRRDESEEVEQGFVDYDGNKAILPNGLQIDLASMGKKKSKRPGALLQQQQPYYRN